MGISPLYAIVDTEVLASRRVELRTFAEQLRAAGVELLQLRAKVLDPREVLAGAAILREVFSATGCKLIMNDRADLAVLADFDGVHVGQGDLTPEDARRVVGPDRWIGVSTHTADEIKAAARSSADYVAIGPVFATGSKADAAPVVGLEGVRLARSLSTKPLVAIGGITRDNALDVLTAGADAVAVLSGLLPPQEPVEEVARDFLRRLR